jgi:hypothetical protein
VEYAVTKSAERGLKIHWMPAGGWDYVRRWRPPESSCVSTHTSSNNEGQAKVVTNSLFLVSATSQSIFGFVLIEIYSNESKQRVLRSLSMKEDHFPLKRNAYILEI